MDDGHEGQSRRRQGSLRKTVLLGVERLRSDRHDGPKSPPKKPKQPTKFAFELPSANSSTESHAAETPPPPPPPAAGRAESEAGATSPPSPADASYTEDDDDDEEDEDDDDEPPATVHRARPSTSPSPPSSDASSAPTSTGSVRQRHAAPPPTAKKKTGHSPLGGGGGGGGGDAASATHAAAPAEADEEDGWDYTETARWGWVILGVTWAVFVVGMGSCLEVWSWAWDVGQTPYAPPELEDDPTLPIVGYYPALFVLTAVVSWIWVMAAWMGLKYFKHAKVQGEDA